MRKARRGQLENAGHFAVLVACRLRSPIALSEEESQRVVVQGHRCVALASLTRSNCRKASSLPFFLSFNLHREDCSPKQFFFPTAVLGVAFSSLRRKHLRDLLPSQFFFFRSAFAGALLSFFSIFLLVLCSFLCRGEGNFCRWSKVCLSLDCLGGGFRFCS